VPRRKVFGPVAPLAGGAHQIKHRVEQLAIGVFAWPSQFTELGQEAAPPFLFVIPKASGVSHPQYTATKDARITAFSTVLFSFSDFSNRL
jgi:hypothetical protein